MQNGAREPTNTSSPSISADFLTGSTEIGLDRIRTRLLDLTNRNKLLNFRHSPASSLRVVDVPIDTVFRQLRDTEKFGFMPVPEPDAAGGEAPSAKDYADELGWNTSFDLGNSDDRAECLPVLLYHDHLDTLSRKIASAAKTAIEESGANMLYLVFGFLEWYESDDSKQPHLAPLVVLPVSIERTGGRGKAIEAVLEYSGEDVETNLSLVEKMRRDFGLEVPPIEEDDTPEIYFAKFTDILKLKKTWSILAAASGQVVESSNFGANGSFSTIDYWCVSGTSAAGVCGSARSSAASFIPSANFTLYGVTVPLAYVSGYNGVNVWLTADLNGDRSLTIR